MEPITIATEIHDSAHRLVDGTNKLFRLAKNKAESERTYRKALRMSIMGLREKGVQATLIPDLARGEVADLKYERDLADVLYTAGRDALEAIQAQMNGLQSILKVAREVDE